MRIMGHFFSAGGVERDFDTHGHAIYHYTTDDTARCRSSSSLWTCI